MTSFLSSIPISQVVFKHDQIYLNCLNLGTLMVEFWGFLKLVLCSLCLRNWLSSDERRCIPHWVGC
jgi:hypothetical protein